MFLKNCIPFSKDTKKRILKKELPTHIRLIQAQSNSERSDECIDFTMIFFFVSVYSITSRNNAPISNYGGGFRCKSEYPWCIIETDKSSPFRIIKMKIKNFFILLKDKLRYIRVVANVFPTITDLNGIKILVTCYMYKYDDLTIGITKNNIFEFSNVYLPICTMARINILLSDIRVVSPKVFTKALQVLIMHRHFVKPEAKGLFTLENLKLFNNNNLFPRSDSIN
ncbi:hypothetical protein AGLY_015748 [Aphis glycines]|uniref:Uncharacterized protein n=1 Tax=Aphis glycines TaxID=307491 RepID=A0A6G0SZN7_APHGL|nr:hypothetical protein AGLY_015748 [Aphis glycines]